MKTTILFALLISTVSGFSQTDFTGKWKLNPDKSQFNETPGKPAAANLLVEQKAGTITLQRNDRAKETLKIDSTAEIENNNDGPGGGKTKISMKLTPDKRGLIERRV